MSDTAKKLLLHRLQPVEELRVSSSTGGRARSLEEHVKHPLQSSFEMDTAGDELTRRLWLLIDVYLS